MKVSTSVTSLKDRLIVFKKAELVELCKELKLKGYSKLNKAELVEFIQASEEWAEFMKKNIRQAVGQRELHVDFGKNSHKDWNTADYQWIVLGKKYDCRVTRGGHVTVFFNQREVFSCYAELDVENTTEETFQADYFEQKEKAICDYLNNIFELTEPMEGKTMKIITVENEQYTVIETKHIERLGMDVNLCEHNELGEEKMIFATNDGKYLTTGINGWDGFDENTEDWRIVYHGGTACDESLIKRGYEAENGGFGYHVTPFKDVAEAYGEVHTYVLIQRWDANESPIVFEDLEGLVIATSYYESWGEQSYKTVKSAVENLKEYCDNVYAMVNSCINATGEIENALNWCKKNYYSHYTPTCDSSMNRDGVVREIIVLDTDCLIKL